MVAATSTVCATPTFPGELVIAAVPVCEMAGCASATADTMAARRIEIRMALLLFVENG
jgi:hypothetical protein